MRCDMRGTPLTEARGCRRFGRKPSFIFSLGVTLGSCLMAAGSWNIWMLVAFRVLMAIGGTLAATRGTHTQGHHLALIGLA